MKKITTFLLLTVFSLVFILGGAAGCDNNGEEGNMKLSENKDSIVIENDKIRIGFNKYNGSIREIYNKVAAMYFIEDNDEAEAVSLRVKGTTRMVNQRPKDSGFKYTVVTDTKAEKALQFVWQFDIGAKVTGTAALKSGSDEIIFKASVSGTDGDVYAVQYPIVDNITTLTDDGSDDYFVSSFATGYLFENPYKNFVRYGEDISGQSAAAPSGFGSTMQFMGYYTKDKGGFYVQTKDGGNTVKDFVFKNDGGTLQMEIGHYVADLSRSTVRFEYETVIANLCEGNWYEPAERYKAWAVQQSWVKKNGLNRERTDLNKDLYENSVLVNFIAPSKSGQQSAGTMYETVRRNITEPNSKILTIPFYYSIPQEVGPDDNIEAFFNTHKNEAFYTSVRNNGEPVAQFEYTDLHLERKMAGLPDYIKNSRMKDEFGGYRNIMFAENWQYICASNEQWTRLITERQRKQFTDIDSQGIYNDLGICAVHPLNCYDESHAHGSNVNALEDYYNLLEKSHEISRAYTVDKAGNNGFTGQEMITENVLPYVDFYQTRAASGEMGGMEHDQIMKMVQNDVAVKIPLFEYVYHEYAGVRGDGFTLPVSSVGVPYYQAMAFTALNGGIPEFNYECYDHSKFDTLAGDLDVDMIKFINTLGKARLTYGKDFLVYGEMARPPELSQNRQQFSYETPIVINWSSVGGTKRGNMMLEPVVASAFKSGGKAAVFLCNITGESVEMNFTLNAGRLYGIGSGTVSCLRDGVEIESPGSLNGEGKAEIGLNLKSRKVYMLTIG